MFAFIPHGHCYLWQPNLVWLHLLSDSGIAIAYFSIPLTLIHLVKKREDLPFNWIFLLFAGFIIFCGLTHALEVWTLWHPIYWVSGSLKALTAVISCVTAVVLLKLTPQILMIPSLEKLESANQDLQHEVKQRQAMEAQVRDLNVTLEKRVAERTAALEEARVESEQNRQQLRAILDNTTSIIYVKDLDGRLILINDGFAELFNRTSEEMLGLNDFDYLPDAIAEQTRSNDRQVLEQRSPVEFEEYVSINGKPQTYISAKFPLFDRQGNPYALGGISTDITERKFAEEELAQRAKELTRLNHELRQTQTRLESQNQALDEFTYIVSHDLKAPLRAISNLSEWIEEDLEESLTAETRQQMELLRDRVHRMELMIQGLLNYSRAGRTEATRELVDIETLLKETIDLLAPSPDFNIQVMTAMPVINTEKILLSQVFMNLISNAIKHHHRTDGKIEIRADQFEHGYQFSVTDDGPGIDPEDHRRVFNIFQSLSQNKNTYNTGIGLAIVKKIITGQGGDISLSSEMGQGTTFRFTWFD